MVGTGKVGDRQGKLLSPTFMFAMPLKVDAQKIRSLREQKLWSQEQLAVLCNLNIRTIQRIETSGVASRESLSALASVFQVEASLLLPVESDAFVASSTGIPQLSDIIPFNLTLRGVMAIYCAGLPALFIVNLLVQPQQLWSLKVILILVVVLLLLLFDYQCFKWLTRFYASSATAVSALRSRLELSFVFHLNSFAFVLFALWLVNLLFEGGIHLSRLAGWWGLLLLFHLAFYLVYLFVVVLPKKTG